MSGVAAKHMATSRELGKQLSFSLLKIRVAGGAYESNDRNIVLQKDFGDFAAQDSCDPREKDSAYRFH